MQDPKPRSAEDVEWIRRCQRGEREAFEPLVERYRRKVFGLVFHLVRRRDEVEDLAQEIFIKAFASIRSYNFRSSFGTWLARIAVNHCYDYLRSQRVSRLTYSLQTAEGSGRELSSWVRSVEDLGPSPEQQAVARDLADKLLAQAPADDRIILTLKELEELSVEEISEILKLKPSTVKVRLHRARKRMLEDMKRMGKGG